MGMKKSQLIDIVKIAIRQQIKQYILPAIEKIIQNQFKKFKLNQKIMLDSSPQTKSPKVTQSAEAIKSKQQLRSRLKQRLGITDFNPKTDLTYNAEQPVSPPQKNRGFSKDYLSQIMGQSAIPRMAPEQIIQDDNFDPLTGFDASPELLAQQRAPKDPYAFEQDLDDIDPTIGYRDSAVDNPANLAKLGLKIKNFR